VKLGVQERKARGERKYPKETLGEECVRHRQLRPD